MHQVPKGWVLSSLSCQGPGASGLNHKPLASASTPSTAPCAQAVGEESPLQNTLPPPRPTWRTGPGNPTPLPASLLTSTMGVSGGFSCLSSFTFLPFLTSLLGSLASSPSISSLARSTQGQ